MVQLSRRKFIQVSACAGAMVVNVQLPAFASNKRKLADNHNVWSVYLTIHSNNSIVIESPVQEMGQHMKTTGAMILAEELCADWALVSSIASETHLKNGERGPEYKYAKMNTGGSQAVRDNWDYLRLAGASALLSLRYAATQKWHCELADTEGKNSFIIQRSTGRKISYGELAEAAAKIPVYDKDVQLKHVSQYQILGKNIKTVDLDEMFSGKPLYAIDHQDDNLLQVVVARCPYFQGEIVSFDDKQCLALPEVVKTIEIKGKLDQRGRKGLPAGVAVVAKNLWSAMKGRKQLKIGWSKGPFSKESDESLHQAFKSLVNSQEPGRTLIDEGDISAAFSSAEKLFEQEYSTPHMAHACMEPFSVAIYPDNSSIRVITGHQFPASVAAIVANVFDVDATSIKVETKRMGGGFGRKALADYVEEAAVVAKAVARPIKVTWTREDDIEQDYFGQGVHAKLKIGYDNKGKITAWHHRQAQISGSIREACFPYGLIDNYRVDHFGMKAGTPIGPWRGPGHLQYAFVTESAIDEIAHLNEIDPLDYRVDLLGEARELPYKGWGADTISTGRMKQCYLEAATMANWSSKREKGIGLGIAGHFTFGSYAAFVLEVDAREFLAKKGPIKITNAWGAIDCGLPLNPNHIKNQMEGGFIDGLNAALYNEVKIANGKVTHNNFHTFKWARISDVPKKIHSTIVENDHPPTGVGEPPTAPAAAALANAIFNATGQRIRQLPISLEV